MHSAVFAVGDTVAVLAYASRAHQGGQVIVVKQGRSASKPLVGQRFFSSLIRAPPQKQYAQILWSECMLLERRMTLFPLVVLPIVGCFS